MQQLIVLGPAGTASHVAAMKIHPHASIELVPTFDGIFDRVAMSSDVQGFVPIENSLHGSVDEILDLLRETKVRLWRVDDVEIHHAFGAKKPKNIQSVASHPQALKQCRKWLKKHAPNVQQIPCLSTAAAAIAAASDETMAAIGLKETLESAGLTIVDDAIEGQDNTTRFATVALEDPFPLAKRTQMTIMFHPREDYPGLLHRLLTPFKIYDINLTRIENRPIGSKIGDYFFYVDFLGNRHDARTQKVLEELRQCADVTVLGEW